MVNNIKHQLFSGVFYTALAKYSGIIISLIVAEYWLVCYHRTTSE